MPIIKLVTSTQFDTALPRDNLVINPVFQTANPAPEYDTLCNDWANAVQLVFFPSSPPEIRVKAYDVQEHPHGPPKAEKVNNVGAIRSSSYPREIALCLSFFAGTNVKRRRGRLYIPLAWFQLSGPPTQRPTVSHQNKVAELVPKLTGLGGVDMDWSVYSKVDDTSRPVSNWFVDNEWDIQRRRGFRGTDRITGTTTE